MIEVNTETDFVAKNASFQEFVRGLLTTIIESKPADIEALMKKPYNGGTELVESTLVEKIAVIGEKISIRRFIVAEGTLTTYIHGNGTAGVIVKFDADDAAKNNSGFAEFAKNIALQIAAGSPPSYVNKEEVPEAAIAEEKAILVQQAKNDPKNAGKPDAILEKMVGGRLGKFYSTNCLSEQEYIKDDSLTVGKYVAQCAKDFGGAIKVVSFWLFEKGEGIQKREEDYAAEIEKLVNNK